MKRLHNRMYKPVTLFSVDGDSSSHVTIEPDGEPMILRVADEEVDELVIGNVRVPIVVRKVVEASGVPAYTGEDYYIVSSLVRSVFHDRDDLLSPDELVRDFSGRVIGSRVLRRNDSDGR